MQTVSSPVHGRMRPISPVRTRKNAPIPGFRSPPKPKARPIEELTVRELRDLYDRNARILSQPAPSTSTYIPRIQAEQSKIEAQLIELEGIDAIQRSLKHTKIVGEEDMAVEAPPTPPLSQAIETKRNILSRINNHDTHGPSKVAGFSFQEAVQIEQQAHALDMERKQRLNEKRQRMGIPMPGEVLSREERDARIWAFMTHKPTESDMEDDDDDDDDDDPAGWFEDDQDDGRKGQDLVEPDEEELADIIRVDENRARYSTFYEPKDEGF
ncbi:hypothetical protein DENSPDRAFT_831013 [Dentipellis sp. KUC8613]|nr:hypothetical protein DENSPDRAFT_831013 [Dentipellis sp. KUC8613]